MIARPLMLLALLALVTALAACAPAGTPAALPVDAGDAVTVADGVVTTSAFSLRAPAGWRIITAPADAPPFVILVAPDNCAVIVAAAVSTDVPPLGECTAPPADALTAEPSPVSAVRDGLFIAWRVHPARAAAYAADWDAVRRSLIAR